MRKIDVPFNIYILDLTPAKLRLMKPVTVMDSTDGATNDFHPQGLFSTEIFYKVGDRRRETVFSYIDIKLSIFHPLIYSAIVKMKRFYADIMACKKYAKWDEQTKEFIPATPVDGETGMNFFIKHWKDINFPETGSTQREQFIMLVNKYKDTALTSNIIVLPAGIRDMEFDENGRKNEDEINLFYRKFLAIANSISNSSITNNPEIVDKSRFELQRNFNLLYDTLENMVKGKKKLFTGSMAGRRTQNGTRNVITAGNPSVRRLGEPGNPTYNSTVMGLFQFSQSIAPVTLHHVRSLLQDVFLDVNQPANLIDPKTLLTKPIQLPAKIFEKWGTNEGLRKTIAEYREESVRDIPIVVAGNYIGLVYTGPDKTFCLFSSIDQLPKDRDIKDVRPMSLTDLLYIALYKDSNEYPVAVTRYPVAGIGSIYPSMVHLRVTSKYERRRRLDRQWQDMGDDWVAHEFPIIGSGFINSLIPHPAHLDRLKADFDGDTGSGNTFYSIEAKNEVKQFLKMRNAYVGSDGNFLYSIGTNTVSIVLANCTGNPMVDKPVSYREEDTSTFTHYGKEYNLNKIFEQLIEGKTQPILLKWLDDQIPNVNDIDPNRLANANIDIPVLTVKEGDKYWLVDGNHRAAAAKAKGKKWIKTYNVTNAMLEKARV